MQAKLRPDLPEMPARIRALPVDPVRNIPVPWFTPWVNGKPEFWAMDGEKLHLAVACRLCWVCGEVLATEKVFVIGPMCAVNRISAEPPSHRECAEFSARACPFLSRPHMTRRCADDLPHVKPAGVMIERNPGVTVLWATGTYQVVRERRGVLFQIGAPLRVECYAEGRLATAAEVRESFDTGLPALAGIAEQQGPEALAELGRCVAVARPLLGIA